MRRALVILLLAVVSAHGSAKDPSNYFVRVSPANAPLKVEPAYYAKVPKYPPVAIKERLSGSGLFILHIGKDGRVTRVDTASSTGHHLLDQEAIGTFQIWRFRPNSISRVRVPIQFLLYPFQARARHDHDLINYGDGDQVTIYSQRPAHLGPNHAMQPTTGRRTLKFSVTQTSHPAATRALASGG